MRYPLSGPAATRHGALRRMHETGVPFQVAGSTRPDLPTRLADGLGFESTLVPASGTFAPELAFRYESGRELVGSPAPAPSGAGLGYTGRIVDRAGWATSARRAGRLWVIRSRRKKICALGPAPGHSLSHALWDAIFCEAIVRCRRQTSQRLTAAHSRSNRSS